MGELSVDRPPGNRSLGSVPEPPPIPPPVPPAGDAVAVPVPMEAARPWGFWATLCFSLVAAGGYVGAQTVVAGIFAAVAVATDQSFNFESLETNGTFLAVATCVSTPVLVGFCVLFAWLRRGVPLRNYLGLHWPSRAEMVPWAVIFVVLVAASDGLTVALGRPIVPEVMVEFYRNCALPPVMWLALIVMAPLGEETLFRGFLLTGLARSKLGPVGAVVLSSLAWAVIHFQYDAYGVGTIFVGGLLLGWARWRTGSLFLAMVIHGAMNLVATLETVWILSQR